MALHAITEREEIEAGYRRLADRLRDGAQVLTRHVGWSGGGGDFPVYWHPEIPLWALADLEDVGKTGYPWFAFGQNNPEDVATFGAITAQISFTVDGVLRSRAGVIARDEEGRLHVAHSGKISGARGVNQNAFLDYHADQPGSRLINVIWSTRAKYEYIPFGPLDGPDLLKNIAAFTEGVARFKAKVAKDAGK